MNCNELWIKDGSLVSRPLKLDGSRYPTPVLIFNFSMVRVDIGGSGTVLQWNMAGANWSSLLFAAQFLETCQSPYRLKYFNAGWIEEVHSDASHAGERLEQLLGKSDIRFSQRVYLKGAMPRESSVPAELRAVIEKGEIPDSISILCKVDFDSGTSNVERIGQDSLLGRVWGHTPVSYPALSGHNYDRVVSQPYFEVLRTGSMKYDQVLASMVMPDGERHWFNYHRVILPEAGQRSKGDRVRVACAQAPVEIALF